MTGPKPMVQRLDFILGPILGSSLDPSLGLNPVLDF